MLPGSLLTLLLGLSLPEHGKLAIYFLQNPVGQETYDITTSPAEILLNASFEYTERNSRVPLTAALRAKPDLTPLEFTIHGKSYRPFSVDAHLTIDRPRSTPFFTIDGYAPFSVQMLMLRYWNLHGKPARLPQLPAGTPDADLLIEVSGHDAISVSGAQVRLTRYSIRNVVWGRESIWTNEGGEIVAAATYAGGLPLEAIQPRYAAALPQLLRAAVADRMAEAAKLNHALPPLASGSFAIVNATLIDGTGRPPIPNATVVVRDGRIVSLGPRPADIPAIDAKGATLLPGLWEMHAHYAQVDWGPAYLASGVTTARDLGNEFDFITAARDHIAAGRILGPRLLLAGLVDGSGPTAFGTTLADTPDQGRAQVARFKAAGFLQMKIYDGIKPEVLRAIAAEAHAQGMSVTGHVPRGMTAVQAVEAGMDQINHLGSVARSPPIQFLKDHATVIDPTMAWNELLGRPMNFEIASFEPGFAKAPWVLTSLIGTAGTQPAPVQQSARFHEMLDVIRQLHDAGIPIVAGTDKAIPGHSLHRELELYLEAGIPPMDVIRLATQGAARVMHMDAEVGTIEPGKRADLILVDGNPLEDFTALRKVTRVITNGKIYDPAALWRSVDFKP